MSVPPTARDLDMRATVFARGSLMHISIMIVSRTVTGKYVANTDACPILVAVAC